MLKYVRLSLNICNELKFDEHQNNASMFLSCHVRVLE